MDCGIGDNMARSRVAKLTPVAAEDNGGMGALRCAHCGAPLRSIPRVVQGAIPIRCEKCFGAAPKTEGVSVGDWLDRVNTPRPARWTTQEAEELSEAA